MISRVFNKVGLVLTAVGLLLVLVLFPACAPEEEVGLDPYQEYVASLPEGCFPVPRDCFEQAVEEGELDIYDWAEWWPEEVYQGFSEEFGIKIIRDNFASTDEVLAKFKLNPQLEYDFVLPDLRAFCQLRELGVLQELNHDWLPNVEAYLPEASKEAWYNPNYEYGAPWDICLTAYSYNSAYVDDPRIPSWSVLFEPKEEYRGRISLIDDMYEVIGSALKYLGYSWNSVDEDELNEAKELLLNVKPYVTSFDSWPARPMLEEEIWLAHQWYGDGWFLHQELETILIALPTEGTQITVDPMVIPVGSRHPAAAHLFINYIFRPEVCALICETVAYTPNHTTAGEFLSTEMQQILPSQEYIDEKCEYISADAYTGRGLELRAAIWEEIKR